MVPVRAASGSLLDGVVIILLGKFDTAGYLTQFGRLGGVCSETLPGRSTASPRVEITSLRRVDVVWFLCHDQITSVRRHQSTSNRAPNLSLPS